MDYYKKLWYSKNEKEIEDILTKKLLKVILNLENNNCVALNNS